MLSRENAFSRMKSLLEGIGIAFKDGGFSFALIYEF